MTNEQETAEVMAMSDKHPEIKAEIDAIESGLEAYAKLHAVEPGNNVKEKIFAKINNVLPNTNGATSTNNGKLVSMSPFWKYAAAAAVILLIGSIVLNVVYYDKYETANKNYAAAVTEKNNAQDQLAALEQSNKEMKNDMNVIQSKYSEPVYLHGQPSAPEAAAKIFWMKNTTGEVYIDPSNLPEPPAGMQYQFWGFVDGKPVDGGMIVFTKKGDKYRIQKMKTFGKAEAFAVTLETEGGHPQPQGQVFVMGKM
jgi:hypothetical protein